MAITRSTDGSKSHRPRVWRRGWTRSLYVLIALVLSLLIIFRFYLLDQLGGAFKHQPEDLQANVSAAARTLVAQAFEGIEPGMLADYHTHVVGLGTDGTGIVMNPRLQSWFHPVDHLKFLVYYSASGIEDDTHPDRDYVERLSRLVGNIDRHGRYLALAYDYYYRPDGTIDREKSEFYVPNAYVFELAKRYPKWLVPAMSVHPYRRDALAALAQWASRGGRVVKWLPNTQGMDSADPRCDPYFEKMKALGLILLSHTGEEQAVGAGADQELGNPLRLRRALDHGVKVIAAHSASLGTNDDLDHPGQRATSFQLFLRLMDEPKYRELLYGEISAITQFNRMGDPLATLLERDDLHHRLVNGSDYPLPAVNMIVRTKALENAGYLTAEERAALNEIYDYNPLLFDFVLKRTLHHPVTGSRFPVDLFKAHQDLSVFGGTR